MDNSINHISGWLKVSGNSLLDSLPSGSGICRVVPVESAQYWTGYVSTAGGSFKSQGENHSTSGSTSAREVNSVFVNNRLPLGHGTRVFESDTGSFQLDCDKIGYRNRTNQTTGS